MGLVNKLVKKVKRVVYLAGYANVDGQIIETMDLGGDTLPSCCGVMEIGGFQSWTKNGWENDRYRYQDEDPIEEMSRQACFQQIIEDNIAHYGCAVLTDRYNDGIIGPWFKDPNVYTPWVRGGYRYVPHVVTFKRPNNGVPLVVVTVTKQSTRMKAP